MAFTHNSVPTTCTASLITGWHLGGLSDVDKKSNELQFCATALNYVNELIKGGFKLDFAVIHAFITEKQKTDYGLKWFLEKCGFQEVFVGKKDLDSNRHKETGGLSLWVVAPSDYKVSLEAFKKELEDRVKFLNRPKVPDPARLARPDLLLNHLTKGGYMRPNAKVDNPIHQILIKTDEEFNTHMRFKYGVSAQELLGDNWKLHSTRSLKERHAEWKTEKVIFE